MKDLVKSCQNTFSEVNEYMTHITEAHNSDRNHTTVTIFKPRYSCMHVSTKYGVQ